jgi:hypothetical protein
MSYKVFNLILTGLQPGVNVTIVWNAEQESLHRVDAKDGSDGIIGESAATACSARACQRSLLRREQRKFLNPIPCIQLGNQREFLRAPLDHYIMNSQAWDVTHFISWTINPLQIT